MKVIFEALGEMLPEVIGAAAVILGLGGALVALHSFGDIFISYFL